MSYRDRYVSYKRRRVIVYFRLDGYSPNKTFIQDFDLQTLLSVLLKTIILGVLVSTDKSAA